MITRYELIYLINFSGHVQKSVCDVDVEILSEVMRRLHSAMSVEHAEKRLWRQVLHAKRSDVQVLHDRTSVFHRLAVAHLLREAVVVSVDGEAGPAHEDVVVQVQLVPPAVRTDQLQISSVRRT